MPRLLLSHASGSTAEVYLHGAHLTSWMPAGGSEALFLSRAAVFRPDTAIRGGIPVIFPQFAGLGPLPKHGFARTQEWEWIQAEARENRATLQLRDSPGSRAVWPYAFTARLTVQLEERSLAVRLSVTNTDPRPCRFTAALHTYLRVAEIHGTELEGLHGVTYRSALEGVDGVPDPEPVLRFVGETDRIYFDAPAELRVHDRIAGRTLRVRSEGFRDVVVWNPWEQRAAALADMHPEEHREMLCVEAARIGEPVQLAPGATWTGEQHLSV